MEVEIISEESIKPSSPTPHHLRTYNLSLLDYLVGYPYVPIVFYYPNHNDNDNNIFQALQRSLVLKKSLSETLTQFYPLAGTLKGDSIECNDVGANYVLVLVHGRLDGFLHKPDLGLINRFLPLEPSFDQSSVGSRVTNVQVNIFKCGGIAVGLCVSHKILDGAALYTFLKGWANMASKSEEVTYPKIGDEWYVAMQKLLQQMGEIGSVGPTEYYIFTSWCKMGFNDIDFGWGKPSWVSGLIGKGFKGFFNLVTLMDTKCGEGVEAWVTLDEEELKILQCNPELLAYASVDPSPLSNDHVI
ncbi:epi-neemfruitin B 7-O-acetyltransferse L7AT-like [Bidens hawaiensis]|uniref:epi-neemfruitin B 7-O-acetyltransferse L7AT-like n=1 Tax=Bidens hawaiensis TaxID=980011 RepID=UPI004049EFEB